MNKTCQKCKKSLELNMFHKHKGRKYGVAELCKTCRNIHMVEKRHSLKEGDLAEMKTKQNNCCAICKTHIEKLKKRLAVDHCHKSGKVRGLLCGNCNNGIGRFKDRIDLLQRAICYLKRNANE